jgi:acyl-CoA reductase-like NAD-dependent aldehyde dehydrogenase
MLAQQMLTRDKLFIGGEWVEPEGDGTITVVNPTTEEPLGTVPAGTAADVDKAVAAARRAFPGWSVTTVEERKDFLRRFAEVMDRRGDELAELIMAEVGSPVGIARPAQVGFALNTLRAHIEVLDRVRWEERIANSIVVKEPVGVVGCITPWNFPLQLMMAKIAPVLSAGCTMVLKPTEVKPLTAFVMAGILDEAGLPPGVFNLVSGDGPTVGEALASHPDVDMISLTGSTAAGRRVAELASQTVKRLHLELGGKSANVILDDADLERAVRTGIDQVFFGTGQTCLAWSRMLVPRARLEEAKEIARRVAEGYRVGEPEDPESDLGPVVSEVQRDRVRGLIEKGIEEGAEVVTGGSEQPEDLAHGFFIRPTILVGDNDMTVAKQEIFGPVVLIVPYEDEEDAIRIANDSIYGLHGAVWSEDIDRATKVARRIQTGRIDINGAPLNLVSPFGGFKQSGLGRELGVYGIEEFLEAKSLQYEGDTMNLDVGIRLKER